MTSVAGAVTAVLWVMLLSALGLGALLAASEAAFTVTKVRGRGLPHLAGHQDVSQRRRAFQPGPWFLCAGRSVLYLQGVLVGASNPKAVLFFAAFFPQFINPSADLVPQLAVLAATFVAFEFECSDGCAPWASRGSYRCSSTSGLVKWINRLCGGLFTVMGGLLLLTRRHTNFSLMDLPTFLIQLLNSVQYGLLLFMLAAGLTLIFGIMGVVNLAHGSFYMLGAYLAWSLSAH
jgi:threonine/homoserine/homoserine lactone efflux protein